MTEKDRMLKGALYMANDEELRQDYYRCRRLLEAFNSTPACEEEKKRSVLQELLGKTGNNIHIEAPFHCDYGHNIYVGENFYANFDCIILDVCPVTIGNNVLFAPRVSVYTAAHPIDAEVRNTGLEYGSAVTIGDNVWIGGSVVINPGVTIGSNVVIGSGSVVTKDIPDNVVAVGNPCRVLRPITQKDKIYWQDLQRQYEQG